MPTSFSSFDGDFISYFTVNLFQFLFYKLCTGGAYGMSQLAHIIVYIIQVC